MLEVPEIGVVLLDGTAASWDVGLSCRYDSRVNLIPRLATGTSAEWWAGREQMARVCWEGHPIFTGGAHYLRFSDAAAWVSDMNRDYPEYRHWLELASPPLPPEWPE